MTNSASTSDNGGQAAVGHFERGDCLYTCGREFPDNILRLPILLGEQRLWANSATARR